MFILKLKLEVVMD